MILSIFSKRKKIANTNPHSPESNWFPPRKAHHEIKTLKINPPRYGLAGSLA